MPSHVVSALSRFDELAESYEDWFRTRLGSLVDRLEKELILSLVRPRPGQTVLEVGSGTGHFLHEIAGRGARCVGLEPSSEMLAVASQRPHGGIVYVRGRGESLPFTHGAFDCLLYMTTLEFVQDVDAAIQEARRVVRSGGRLVCGVLNADGPWARARKREAGLWGQARFYRALELRSLLAPLGPTRLEYCVHVPPGLGWLPAPALSLADWLFRSLLPASGALIGVEVILEGT